VLHKNGQARNSICTLKSDIILNTTTLLSTNNYQNWLISVEDIASQSRHSIQHDRKDPISGVHVSPGSAEILVNRDWITNNYSTACSLSNISAKNYQYRLNCIEVIVCNVSVVFWDTVCTPCFRKKHQLILLAIS